MAKWIVGTMLRSDVGLKKGDKVVVKRNDDLTKWFLAPNWSVFSIKKDCAVFYVDKVLRFYVEPTSRLASEKEKQVDEQWEVVRKRLRKSWKAADGKT
jgi:hypothetical protein